ncbi:MAG TPA: hypothetical protein DEQ61_20980 [Streptomyces sp.]|nr:hypothetical protein [Streptomyces sp.]
MRTLSSACAVTAAAAAALLLAPSAYATPPGDNGNVKIHDSETGERLKKNEPHVCAFYLDAFKFDTGQEASWKIVEMPPTGVKGTVVESGTLTLDADGHGRTEDMTLPDGHYKLAWKFVGEKGKAKHKVFWTDCEDEIPVEETPDTTLPTPTESKPAAEEPSDEPTGTPETTGAAAPAPAPSSNSGADGDLAETGAGTTVVGASVAAVVLLGAGGVLMMRRRTRGQN